VYAAAQALRLSYDSLRKRAEAAVDARRVRRESRQPQATFVELPPALLSVAAAPSGPIVEVVGPSGQRLTVQLRSGDLDVAELIRACWSGRA
jgi:butyrate kinase